MIMLVLFSNLVGVALREWRRCRKVTDWTIALALVVLTGAVVLLSYGNYLGDQAAKSQQENHETIRNGDRPAG
jgi:L-rhamnose-H+ transport protein